MVSGLSWISYPRSEARGELKLAKTDLNDIRTALILGGDRGDADGRAEAWSDGQSRWIEGGGQAGQASSRSMKESERASTLDFKRSDF